ncbi:ABC transporter ATP-binding protein [Streptomyces flavofungini]|uniref:ABC transporter ATP-binding protein n=1 Tax=Streptomyces flavofungini TaxID=68200 RepID=A0ABS0XJ08_9ACTN|nr:ABC transporter ATP-binding protein [Streptomyces flavofungini]MBJ3813195.1 ABC transporter ATP-binding protein [Streptomyces flavofungini]GHC90219.1 ABC transporter ATP-binding protein [Streptomyces flavofungini]
MIEITNLTKRFTGNRGGTVHALSEVDLTIADNEFVTVLGPSGCGKTTLLRALAGLTGWDEGDILVDGEPVRSPGPERAMVFQNFALLPWASVLDNVAFGLELRGEARGRRHATARELIGLVGLDGFEDRLPGELSGGMQQRVGLARALAVQPRVLLMDEPFGALDEQTRRILQQELLTIWERRRLTVVFITHSIEEAVLLGDRVVLMSPRPGRIAETVPVDIPRPRSFDLHGLGRTEEFTTLTTHLWERLRSMHPDTHPDTHPDRAGARR